MGTSIFTMILVRDIFRLFPYIAQFLLRGNCILLFKLCWVFIPMINQVATERGRNWVLGEKSHMLLGIGSMRCFCSLWASSRLLQSEKGCILGLAHPGKPLLKCPHHVSECLLKTLIFHLDWASCLHSQEGNGRRTKHLDSSHHIGEHAGLSCPSAWSSADPAFSATQEIPSQMEKSTNQSLYLTLWFTELLCQSNK